MQAATFLALDGLTCNKVANVNHIAELADVTTCLHTLKQFLCFLIEQIQTVLSTLQTKVRTNYANIV